MNSFNETVAPMCLSSDSPDITASDQISQMFPAPPYLHTRNNKILEVTKALASSAFCACRGRGYTKACEQRLSFSCTPCVNYAQRYPWNAYPLRLCVVTN